MRKTVSVTSLDIFKTQFCCFDYTVSDSFLTSFKVFIVVLWEVMHIICKHFNVLHKIRSSL